LKHESKGTNTLREYGIFFYTSDVEEEEIGTRKKHIWVKEGESALNRLTTIAPDSQRVVSTIPSGGT